MINGCCVTGHRNIPLNQVDYVNEELRKQIINAIKDGYTHFISGMANGTDLYFAEIVAEYKAQNPNITLEAAIPHRKRLSVKNPKFQNIIKSCDLIHVESEKYNKSSYLNRNKYMVDNSARIIAVYDGRNTGGTKFTLRYANKKNKEVYIIALKNSDSL